MGWLLSNIWWIGPLVFTAGVLGALLTLALCRVGAQADSDALQLYAARQMEKTRKPRGELTWGPCPECGVPTYLRQDGKANARYHRCALLVARLAVDADPLLSAMQRVRDEVEATAKAVNTAPEDGRAA